MSKYNPYKEIELDHDRLLNRTLQLHTHTTIFRGVSNSEYDLIPSALREDGKNKLKTMAKEYLKHESMRSVEETNNPIGYEIASLEWFYDMANRQGLNIPDIPHNYFGDGFVEISELTELYEPFWMNEEWFEIAALAQHYGIPTRLLDWSYDMNVAIYFAIQVDENLMEENPDGSIAIWELDKAKISMICNDIRFVVPKYCGNPNIRAQSGIMSIMVGNSECYSTSLKEAVINGFNNLSGDEQSLLSMDDLPVLTKLKIPYSEVPIIKENFENRGIRYDTIFPGLGGVVRTMKQLSGLDE